MNRIIHWFAENHVAANLLMVLIIVGGILSLSNINRELYPSVALDQISIQVLYPGASSQEVEDSIVKRIENAIQDLDGIQELRSWALENQAYTIVKLSLGFDINRLLNEIKNRVNGIGNFPKGAEKPIIKEDVLKIRTISVAVSGLTDEVTLKKLGEEVTDEIRDLEGVSQAELSIIRPYEIGIEISESTLHRYGLSLSKVVNAIRKNLVSSTGAALGGSEKITFNKLENIEQLEQMVVASRPDGTRLTIADLSEVQDGFVEEDKYARFDGKPSVLVRVYRVGSQDVLQVAESVKEYVGVKSQEKEGVTLTTWQDDSVYFKARLELLINSAVSGLFLVLFIMVLFLPVRLAFWVAVGIPVAFLGVFWAMPFFDASFNQVSLFAFILVLGLVVDDAVVVGESIAYRQERGEAGLKGAVRGTLDVGKPVIFSVLTSIVAFLPIVFLPGATGKLWSVVSVVVILALLFSLLECLLIMPAHLSTLDKPVAKNVLSQGLEKIRILFSAMLDRFIRSIYKPFLHQCITWRYLVLASFIGLFILTSAVVSSGWVRMVFFPEIAENVIVVNLTMPEGTTAEETSTQVLRIEQAILDIKAEIEAADPDDKVILHTMSIVGEQTRGGRRTFGNSGPHLGEVTIELAPAENRSLSIQEVIQLWRDRVGDIPEAVKLSYDSGFSDKGDSINLQISAPSLDKLQKASQELKEKLRQFPGVYDVSDSIRQGKDELRLSIKPEAENLGLSLADLAEQVNQGFHGVEVTKLLRGRDEIPVVIRYPREQRQTLDDLRSMRIRTPDGTEVPFFTVAKVEYESSLAFLQRTDRKRTIYVTANLDTSIVTSSRVMADLKNSGFLAGLEQKYRGVDVGAAGLQKEQNIILESLIRGFILATLGIYALMAIPFRSYFQPLIVMTAIPFGFVGAVFGHIIMSMDLSLLSFTGIVAVTGVVVNDSLVLVDYVNQGREKEGMRIYDAVMQGAEVRFRPILLTSLTTYFGLIPIMFNGSVETQDIVPMAVSLGYGVLFATFITLILVPVSYLILDDLLVRYLKKHPDVEKAMDDDAVTGNKLSVSNDHLLRLLHKHEQNSPTKNTDTTLHSTDYVTKEKRKNSILSALQTEQQQEAPKVTKKPSLTEKIVPETAENLLSDFEMNKQDDVVVNNNKLSKGQQPDSTKQQAFLQKVQQLKEKANNDIEKNRHKIEAENVVAKRSNATDSDKLAQIVADKEQRQVDKRPEFKEEKDQLKDDDDNDAASQLLAKQQALMQQLLQDVSQDKPVPEQVVTKDIPSSSKQHDDIEISVDVDKGSDEEISIPKRDKTSIPEKRSNKTAMAKAQQRINEAESFDDLIHAAIAGFHKDMGVNRVAFMRMAGDDNIFTVRALAGNKDPNFTKFKMALDDSALLAELMSKPQSIFIHKENRHEFMPLINQALRDAFAVDSFILISLYIEDQPLGFLFADAGKEQELSKKEYLQFKQLGRFFNKALEKMKKG